MFAHARRTGPAAAVSLSLLSTRQPLSFAAAPSSSPDKYDLVVIGGGSGGLAAAKRAAGYGAKVAIIEGKAYGGTCVNVGCVPKKIMYNASHVAETMEEAHHFAFHNVAKPSFDWGKMKTNRDTYIKRLNGTYESGLTKLNVTRYDGWGKVAPGGKVIIDNNTTIETKHTIVAPGGDPNKLGVPGEEHVIDSDGFFALEKQPKKVAVIGAGYIAVEIAGVFQGLGTDTTLFVRGSKALRNFDPMVSDHLKSEMEKSGMGLVGGAVAEKVVKEKDGTLSLHLTNGKEYKGFDVIMAATGRTPKTKNMGLEDIRVAVDDGGHITVDDYQNTNIPNVYALGDACNKHVDLTPMAIAAGRRLADRLFGGMPKAKADYDLVPTVVFSHPVIGTCGLTEPEAEAKYGKKNITVYTSTFVNLYYGIFFNGQAGPKPLTRYKVITTGPEERVVGLHMIGMGSDEVLQGFGVAMKMGATKADFDSCVAIHPTAAEEMVTLAPWGLKK